MKNRTTIFIRSLQRESLVLQIWRWTYLLTKILNIFTHVRIFATLGGRIIRHTNAESSSKRNSRRNVSFTLENEESHDLLSRNFQHSHWHGCAFHSTRLSAEGTLDNYNTHTHTQHCPIDTTWIVENSILFLVSPSSNRSVQWRCPRARWER